MRGKTIIMATIAAIAALGGPRAEHRITRRESHEPVPRFTMPARDPKPYGKKARRRQRGGNHG